MAQKQSQSIRNALEQVDGAISLLSECSATLADNEMKLESRKLDGIISHLKTWGYATRETVDR